MQLAPPLGILLGSEPPGLVMTNYLILFVSGFLERRLAVSGHLGGPGRGPCTVHSQLRLPHYL